MSAESIPKKASLSQEEGLPFIVSFSDNRWDSGLTGRQHVLGRLAKRTPVMFVNPPHNLMAQNGWSNPGRWRAQLHQDRSGAQVLDWPVWLGQSFKPNVERFLLEQRRRHLVQMLERNVEDSLPILYVWHPDAWPLVERLPARLVCYHVYDHYEMLSPSYQSRISARHEKLAERADVVICVSDGLAERFGGVSERVHVVPNGADVAHFAQEGLPEPAEIADLPRPRLMLVARFNGNYRYGLMRDLVEKLQLPLVMAGPRRGMPEEIGREFDELIAHPLVRWIGEQPFERLPELIAHCDVGLIPYRAGTSSDFASPLKLFEYLAAGKGVVASDIEAVRPYRDEVAAAATLDQWSADVGRMIAQTNPQRTGARRQLAWENSWDARVGRIETILAKALDRTRHIEDGELAHAG